MFACWSNLIRLLFPFKYPMKLDSLILGGIHTNQCIWSGQASNSIIFYAFPLTQFSFYLSYGLFDFPIFHLSTILRGNHFVIHAIPGCVWYTPCVDFHIDLLCLFARGWLDLLAWYLRSFFCSTTEVSLDPPALLVVFVNQKENRTVLCTVQFLANAFILAREGAFDQG